MTSVGPPRSAVVARIAGALLATLWGVPAAASFPATVSWSNDRSGFGQLCSGKSLPPTGNGALQCWEAEFPNPPNAHLVPPDCTYPFEQLVATCPGGGCGEYFVCAAAYACPNGASPTVNHTCPGCTAASCNDHDACNGTETCMADGGCAPGTPVDCNDNLACTTDACIPSDGGCTHQVDPAKCACNPSTVPKVDVSVGPETVDLGIACPVVGGRTGVTARLSGQVTGDGPTCANRCTSVLEGSAAGKVGLSLCGSGPSLKVAASYGDERVGCPTCDASTCDLGCDLTKTCETRTGSVSTQVGTHRKLGETSGREGLVAGLQVAFQCTAGVSGEVGGSFTHDATSGSASCQSCTQCTTNKAGFQAGGQGSGSCAVALRDKRGTLVSVVDKKGLVLGLDAVGTHDFQRGACGDHFCASARADVKARARTPEIDAPAFRWFQPVARLVCQADFDACGEVNSCGPCTCGGGSCTADDTRTSCALEVPVP